MAGLAPASNVNPIQSGTTFSNSATPALAGSAATTAAAAAGGPAAWIPIAIAALSSMNQGENVAGVTPEQQQAAIDAINKYYGQAMNQYTAPYDIGTATSTPAMKAQESKAAGTNDALYGYATEVLGLDADSANAWVRKNASRKLGDIGGKKDVSFKDYIRTSGANYGLKVGNKGGIKGIARPASVTGQRAPLDSAQQVLAGEVFGAAAGLPTKFSEDAQAGLDYKNQIRGLLASQYDPEAGLDAAYNADFAKIMDAQKAALRGAFSELTNSGFASSSLAGETLANRLKGATDSLYTNLQGNQANLRSQNIRDMLASATYLGGPQTYGQYMSGSLTAPSEYGGTDDPFSINQITGKQAGGAAIKQAQGNALAGANLTPTIGGGDERNIAAKFYDPLGMFT